MKVLDFAASWRL